MKAFAAPIDARGAPAMPKAVRSAVLTTTAMLYASCADGMGASLLSHRCVRWMDPPMTASMCQSGDALNH